MCYGACTLCLVEVCLDIALINVVVIVECIYQWHRQGGEGGEAFPPYGWMSKNYVICVCFHCRGTSSYHTTNTKPYKFPMHCSKCVSFWGTSYSRPPIDPYLTPACYRILAAPFVFSHSVATSSAECNHCSSPSSLVCGQLLTVCNIVWRFLLGHMSVAARPHLFRQDAQWPWLVQK